MFSIKTRSYGLDYSMGAFNTQLSSSWLTKYCKSDTKLNYIRDGSEIDIFLETNSDKWFLYFGKIPSQRKSSAGQSVYSSIIAEGQMTDEDSKKLVYKLLYHVFFNSPVKRNIEAVLTPAFEKEFDADFINSLDSKRNDEQTNEVINDKIISFITALPAELENKKLIELTNLEFNTYEKKVQNSEILSVLYSLLFSESQNTQKVFVCTSTAMNQDKINQMKTALGEDAVGLVLTTSDDAANILPQTFNKKKTFQKPAVKTTKKITHINILAITILSIIALLTGYTFIAWNFFFWPFEKDTIEQKTFYTYWSEKDKDDNHEIAYFRKEENSTELYIEFCSLDKPVSLKLDEDKNGEIVTISISIEEPLKEQTKTSEIAEPSEDNDKEAKPEESKESKSNYTLTADQNSKKEKYTCQRVIKLFGKGKHVGESWIEEKK